MKKMILMALLSALSGMACAQTAVTSMGGFYSGGGGSFSCSLGQVATHASANGGQSIHEGVIQPVAYIVESITVPSQTDDVKVYPNPTTDGVTVFRQTSTLPMSVELYSIDGSRLSVTACDTESTFIDMSSLASGVYVLSVRKIVNGKYNQVSTYKVTKK